MADDGSEQQPMKGGGKAAELSRRLDQYLDTVAAQMPRPNPG